MEIAVFIREPKLARNTHCYNFSMWTSLHSNPSVNFPEHKANYTAGCKKSSDYDVMLGGITQLIPMWSWTLHVLSTMSPKLKKSSTIKGPKSSFWISSFLNQQLIVSNLQNQSMTDRLTGQLLPTSCAYALRVKKQQQQQPPTNIVCWKKLAN